MIFYSIANKDLIPKRCVMSYSNAKTHEVGFLTCL